MLVTELRGRLMTLLAVGLVLRRCSVLREAMSVLSGEQPTLILQGEPNQWNDEEAEYNDRLNRMLTTDTLRRFELRRHCYGRLRQQPPLLTSKRLCLMRPRRKPVWPHEQTRDSTSAEVQLH